ncbi:MAG TPA: hypothetical protein VF522_22725 [Ramlibacter sp.]|uniref:hypothetical protein n=1 Tax=Ramlibacter sp. TaxID=1917967 RepID=UPI002ED0DBB8
MRAAFAAAAALLAAGGVQAQYYSQSAPYIPSVGEAPLYLKYMSPRCAALHDSIRTGPARGLSSQTISAARKEYERDCSEDERDARSQLSKDQQEGRAQKRAEQQAQAKAVERTKQQEQQCGESKRILKLKKARTDLTDGEKGDLKRFEENYLARCS